MNAKFLRLLQSKGWELRTRTEKVWDSRPMTVRDYVRTHVVNFGDSMIDVPISASFGLLNKDGFPQLAEYSFVLTPEIRPNAGNRITRIKGAYRIMSTLDAAGHLAALKFVMFSHKASHYTKQAKQVLSNANKLPNE